MATETHAPGEKYTRKDHYSLLTYVITWLVLSAITILNWGLAKIDLGGYRLWVAMFLALCVVMGMMIVFMHLWLHHAASRMAMLISAFFVFLLLLITILDVMARFPPTRPKGVPGSDVIPVRPMPTRTNPQHFGPSPPRRLPGH